MIRSAILSVALAALVLPAAGGAMASDAPSVCYAETPVENTVFPSPGEAETDPSFTLPGDTDLPAPEDDADENPGKPPHPHRGHGDRHRRGGETPSDGNGGLRPCPYGGGGNRAPEPRFRGGANGFERTLGTGCAPSSDSATCGIAQYVLGRITPEFIEVYERRVAGCELVSGMSGAELSLAASELKVSEQKFKALVLLADLMARTSKPVPVAQLAAMGDGELLRLARRHAKIYASNLSESEYESLKDELQAAMKK